MSGAGVVSIPRFDRKLDMKLTDEERVEDLDEKQLSHWYGPGCGPVGLS